MRYRIEHNANREWEAYEPQYSEAWFGGWQSFYQWESRPCVRFNTHAEASSFLGVKEMERRESIAKAKEYKSNIKFYPWP